MNFVKAATALAITFAASSAANAAVITRSYTSVATYNRGPLSTLTATATVTFDPNVTNSASLLSLMGSDGDVFNNVEFNYFTNGSFVAFEFGGGPDGVGVMSRDNNDFDWLFVLDNAGEVVNQGYLNYSKVGGSEIYTNSAIVTTANGVSGAVPEPAAWALMIGGFGMVGGAMRRRKVSAKIAFA